MKDRRKRGVSSWRVFFFWCAVALIFFAAFNSSALRLLFGVAENHHYATASFMFQIEKDYPFKGSMILFEGFHPRMITKRNIPAMEAISAENSLTPAISIRETVIFPDQALVFLKYPPSAALFTKDDINCTYLLPNSSRPQLELSPSSVDFDYGNHQIVRCPLEPRGLILSLAVKHNGNLTPGPMYRWDSLAYEAMIDRDNSTIVFVKGLNLRSARVADSSRFKCLYGWDLTKPKFVLSAKAISVAQEIVRCRTPLSILNRLQRFTSSSFNDSIKVSVRVIGQRTLNSIARVKRQYGSEQLPREKQHELCVCTMLRNQARFLREWVMYHAHVGVQRWFIYDNNSDDDIEGVVESLVDRSYKVTRHGSRLRRLGLSLKDVVANAARPSEVAELRVPCHSFGPSGLKKAPMKGVMAGYTCRLAAPERHKSIVKPEALNTSLINVVHHFHLKSGFRHINMNRSKVVINHYKYQVWEVFKEKFYRRVATYVSDWQQERNVGSKDRAPGLGTKAVEPSDWSMRFCEVKDTGLRDRVLKTFTDPKTSLLPWEDHQLDERSKMY
ncbi:Glycosyltransferase family 92 protein RCOM [Sesamum angolense]|uniref:Glycosyltransferase family 92 protein n=1 Tax=Sesamum angolense TaxID=2727404 RepID=A0AAE1XDZ0_9LAMI|nr:Glycosyltransferase family 92 protein RCOM [Sesamum angolense]